MSQNSYSIISIIGAVYEKKSLYLGLLLLLSCNSADRKPASQPEPARPAKALSAPAAPDPELILAGTEPFWSMHLSSQGVQFSEAGGDTLYFRYRAPQAARGHRPDYLQLYHLNAENWVLLRQDSCSDGMSDRWYPYTATAWLNGTLWAGCGRPAN